jgi:hypothetical protein
MFPQIIQLDDLISMKFPNTFIVGASKCGTTSLATWLNQHPHVHLGRMKEPHFLCKHFQLIKELRPYLQNYRCGPKLQVILDASTGYLSDQSAPTLIRAINPDAKIIIMVRNPINRILSLYNHMSQGGNETIRPLERALEAENKRIIDLKFKNEPRKFNYWNLLYVKSTMYDEQVERYLKNFPSEQIYLISLNELQSNPQEWLNKIYKFLELSPFKNQKLLPQNRKKYIKKIREDTKKMLTEKLSPSMKNLEDMVGRNLGLDGL